MMIITSTNVRLASILLVLSASTMLASVLDVVHRNVHFEQYMAALKKFDDYKLTSTHELMGGPKGVQTTIQIRSGSGDMTVGTSHEKYCLTVRIGVIDLADPDVKALTQDEAPPDWVTAQPAEHCTEIYPDPVWNLELNFGEKAVGHGFVVQTTIKCITIDGNCVKLGDDGMYTDELKKAAEAGKLKLDYQMMENDLRNNIKLDGRRLYLLIKICSKLSRFSFPIHAV